MKYQLIDLGKGAWLIYRNQYFNHPTKHAEEDKVVMDWILERPRWYRGNPAPRMGMTMLKNPSPSFRMEFKIRWG